MYPISYGKSQFTVYAEMQGPDSSPSGRCTPGGYAMTLGCRVSPSHISKNQVDTKPYVWYNQTVKAITRRLPTRLGGSVRDTIQAEGYTTWGASIQAGEFRLDCLLYGVSGMGDFITGKTITKGGRTMMAKRAVAYCRVSTKGQCGEDKYGIEAQKRDIEAYCADHDIEIEGWYIDSGISGAKDETERPELRKILNGEVTNPPIQAVVVAKSDRLSRAVEQYYWFKYAFRRMNIELISVNEDFGSAGVFAPVYEAITAAFAEMERQMIKSRMSSGRNVKASKGGYAGGRAPYGYDGGNGTLTVNPVEADAVRMIFALRDHDGKSMGKIAESLNEAGYTNRSGGEFTVSSVQYILKNRKMYEGYYKYGTDGEWIKGKHEPILVGETEGGYR